MHRRFIYSLFSLVLAGQALADDVSGCDKFAWSVKQERGLFSASVKPVVTSGATLAVLPREAFVLKLSPSGAITWTLPPERDRSASGSLGGIVVLPAPSHPGIYQITLSADAWVDVVQDGRYARAVGSSGRGDCEGLRKSLRLELRQLPVTLQVSGVPADAITIAIRPVE
jgi:hypothetical protein